MLFYFLIAEKLQNLIDTLNVKKEINSILIISNDNGIKTNNSPEIE